MDDWTLELAVVYDDRPDMLGLELRVKAGNWSACGRAFCSPDFLPQNAQRLIDWSSNPKDHFRMEAGADTGTGWIVLDFYVIDAAGHAKCAVTLKTERVLRHGGVEEPWCFAIELNVEPWSVENFGRDCLALSRDFSRKATLRHAPL